MCVIWPVKVFWSHSRFYSLWKCMHCDCKIVYIFTQTKKHFFFKLKLCHHFYHVLFWVCTNWKCELQRERLQGESSPIIIILTLFTLLPLVPNLEFFFLSFLFKRIYFEECWKLVAIYDILYSIFSYRGSKCQPDTNMEGEGLEIFV